MNLYDLQIDQLRNLRDGWLDGTGFAATSEDLDWLRAQLYNYYPNDLACIYIYPTPEGGILLEWHIDHFYFSLEIDFKARTGYWHVLNTETDKDEERNLDMNYKESWNFLVDVLTKTKESRKVIKDSIEESKKWRLTKKELEELLK